MIHRFLSRFTKKNRMSLIEELKSKGAVIGDDVQFWSSIIDRNYPQLLKIGNHVTITCSTVLCHDSTTLRELGVRKIGKVDIGDCVFVSAGCVVLPGTIIHDKVIVGAGTTIKGELGGNSVYIPNERGLPQFLCSYDDYISKHRKRIESFKVLKSDETNKNTITNVDDIQPGTIYYIEP